MRLCIVSLPVSHVPGSMANDTNSVALADTQPTSVHIAVPSYRYSAGIRLVLDSSPPVTLVSGLQPSELRRH